MALKEPFLLACCSRNAVFAGAFLMFRWCCRASLAFSLILLVGSVSASQQSQETEELPTEDPAPPSKKPSEFEQGRIVTREEIQEATRARGYLPFRIIAYPFRQLTIGMNKGLTSFEENYMRQKMTMWQQRIREWGFTPLFGGLGEGAGFGGGAIYTLSPAEQSEIPILARATFRGYQEYDVQWRNSVGRNDFVLETSYQWRPQENFYGLGHDSLLENQTKFALRQTWAGGGWQFKPVERIRVGAGYKNAWLLALPGKRTDLPPPDELFPDIVGMNERMRLQSFGVFFEANMMQGEYEWGGRALLETSFQDQLGDGKLRYFTYAIQGEGRMPVASGRSALIGQISVELNRERGGSSPLPFYLHPSIGGSSTLRGFALDRYYGRNLMYANIEYRFRLNPNIQSFIFFDEGQIFNQTSDLSWLNWHRNYGLGFKLKSATGTVMGIEVGYGEDGWNWHLTWGDRSPKILGGPVRYGTYRR
jgi:hypothetical protein